MVTDEISELADKQRKLDAFLVDNEELEALNARLSAFNLFRVLRIENVEIRHSNVLAWMLDPQGSHGLGPTFLRRFLSSLLIENDVENTTLTPAQVEHMDFGDVDVRREWQNIDILVRSQSNGWSLLIENKIRNKEAENQLQRYETALRHEFPGDTIIPVFLTLEGEEPSKAGRDAGYVAFSHVQVLEVAEQTIEQHKAQIPRDAGVFLKHYLDVLRRLTMQDDALVDLCRRIYSTHKEAIDLIVEYGASSQVIDCCAALLPELVDCELVTPRRNKVWFVPRQIADLTRDVPVAKWTSLPQEFPIACWFEYAPTPGILRVGMEVGRIFDPDLRSRLISEIQKNGLQCRVQGKTKSVIGRTESEELRTKDGMPDDSPDYVKDVARSLWSKLWGEGHKITEVLKNFHWEEPGA